MNIEHINNIIKKPETLNYEEDLPLVKELIESFPYFAPGYAMLTKMLHAENSVYFDKYLHLTAAYIGDREVLYNYLYPAQEETITHHLSIVEEKAPENILVEEPRIQEEAVEEGPKTEDIVPEPIIEPEETHTYHIDTEETHEAATEHLQTEEKVSEVIEIAAEKEIIPEIRFQEEATEEPGVEEQVLVEEANNTANENIARVEEFIAPQDEEEKPAIPQLEITPLAAYDYFSAVGKPKTEEQPQEPFHLKPIYAYDEEEIINEEPHSFKEWLDWLEKKKLAAKVKTELIIEKINLPAQDKEQIDEMISTFIRKEPKIKPPQTKFFKPEDMAQQSAVEDFSFVTETLANIYFQQELFAKAIDAFRRLITKHPDKREHFEEKIAEVEKAKKENRG